MTEPIVLRCHKCGLPWATLQNNCIVVQSRHHGEQHVNAISIAKLAEMCKPRATVQMTDVPSQVEVILTAS